MKLYAFHGVRGVGVGGAEYVVDANGALDVPDEYVEAVLGAGFSIDPQPAAPVAE